MEVYLDNSATTKAYPEVADVVVKCMLEDYGNPSSLHNKGLDAEHIIKNSAEIIAKTIKSRPDEIVFTSGGTESNNMAIVGTALSKRRKGKHIIVSAIEHASVTAVMHFLQNEGYEITYIEPDERGICKAEDFAAAVREDTILVSCMHINNEMGSIQPVYEIAKTCKAINKDLYVHVDAIQSYGKIDICPSRNNIDLMSVSGHKLHGPKGTGFLFIKNNTLIRPIIYGGGQQKNMRSGTENVPGIAGLGKAVELTFKNFDERISYIKGLKERLITGLTAIDDVYSNSMLEEGLGAPHIASISFTGVRAEVMLHALEDKGIFVSSGSACSSNKKKDSSVLKSIGLPNDRIESTLRFSFSENNTEEQIDYVIDVVKEILPMLRHYVRG